MKPNFALTLSFEGIGLLHRASSGWHLVGEVAPDGEDLDDRLRALRAKAAALDPAGLHCKLVIPNDQIRYLTIPDDPDADAEAQVLAALDGATPYPVDDLVFDWTRDGETIQIAAVARETLEEAEAFASEHDFAPVGFVAIPDAGAYTGEPFFGPTSQAAGLMPDGGTVERDSVAIRVVSAGRMPEPAPAPAAGEMPPTAAPAPAPDRTPASPPAPAPSGAEPGPAPAKPAPRDDSAPTRTVDTPAPPVVPPAFSSIRASRGNGSDLPASAPRLDSATRLKGLSLPQSPKAKAPRVDVAQPLPDHLIRTGASLLPDNDPPVEDATADTPPAPAASSAPDLAQKPTFLSRRKPRADAPGVGNKARANAAQDARAQRDAERRRMTVFGARQAPVGGKPRFLGLILTALLVLFLVGVAAWASLFLDDGLSRFFGTPERIRVTEVPAVPETEDETAPAALAEPLPQAEPETAEALAMLPPDGDDTRAPETDIAAIPADVADVPIAAADAPPPEAARTPPDGAAALSTYAASGIWQTAPEPPAMPAGPSDIGHLIETALDPDVTIQDVTALPSLAAVPTDRRLATPANPPDPETRFILDERGMVKPTREGALTQEGVTVFAGAPPVTPPNTSSLTPTTSAEDAAVTPAPPQADAETARLAAIRPRARPALPDAAGQAAVDEGAADTTLADDGDAATAAPGGPQISTLRPRLRPDNLLPAALAPEAADSGGVAVDTDAVSAAVANAAEETDPEAEGGTFENATAQAVTASLVPRQRPKGFAAIVEASRESGTTTQPSDDGDDGEPEVTTASLATNLPSSASVAKEATERNVINLRQVNLIGVYGSQNSRRALVRLSNGRYMKVKVGDRLDGGQVAAIGDAELRYVKRGQAVVLKMPKG